MTALTMGIGQERANKAAAGERNGHSSSPPLPKKNCGSMTDPGETHSHHEEGPHPSHDQQARPYWMRAHRDWRFWVGVVCLAAALSFTSRASTYRWCQAGTSSGIRPSPSDNSVHAEPWKVNEEAHRFRSGRNTRQE